MSTRIFRRALTASVVAVALAGFCTLAQEPAPAPAADGQAPGGESAVPEEPPIETGVVPGTTGDAAQAAQDRAKTLSLSAASPGQFTYLYGPANRDPFVDGTKDTSPTGEKRPPGLAGYDFDKCTLVGVALTPGGPVAIYKAPDQRAYTAPVGQAFWDAKLLEVDPETTKVVVRVKVTDPLNLRPFDDKVFYVRKPEKKITG